MSDYLISEETLTNIANAIRSKTGTADLLTPENMNGAIDNIESGLSFMWHTRAEDFKYASKASRLSTSYLTLNTTSWTNILENDVSWIPEFNIQGIIAVIPKDGLLILDKLNNEVVLPSWNNDNYNATFRIIQNGDIYYLQGKATNSDFSTQLQCFLYVYGYYDGSEID